MIRNNKRNHLSLLSFNSCISAIFFLLLYLIKILIIKYVLSLITTEWNFMKSCCFSRKVRELLHHNGMRATMARIKVMNELINIQNPLISVKDVHRRMELKNEVIASTTVYKTLKQLCKFGLLSEETSKQKSLAFKKTDRFSYLILAN